MTGGHVLHYYIGRSSSEAMKGVNVMRELKKALTGIFSILVVLLLHFLFPGWMRAQDSLSIRLYFSV